MLFRTLFALATAAFAVANPLGARQNSNTNPQIAEVLDELSTNVRKNIFAVDQMQANQTATDGTIGTQVQGLIGLFNTASSSLLAIDPSSGSTTDQPTNIELSRTFGETLQLLATGFSGLPAQGSVPNFNAMIAQLDPTVADTANALNTTLPDSLGFVHTLMLDASQFLVAEDSWPETLAAIGF